MSYDADRQLFSQRSFLIVEDSAETRLSLRRALARAGAEDTQCHASADRALEACRGRIFDVIICDYRLSGYGRSGQHLLEELRLLGRLPRTSAFVMLSSETTQGETIGILEVEPDAYLLKPLSPQHFIDRMTRLLRRKQALARLERAIEREQDNRVEMLATELIEHDDGVAAYARRLLAEHYVKQREFNAARELYQAALNEQPGSSWARLGLGEIEYLRQNLPRAERLFSQLIEEQPLLLTAYDRLARCYWQRGQLELAQATLAKAAKLSPNAVRRHIELGRLAHRNQDLEAAVSAYQRVVRLANGSVHEDGRHELAWARCLTELSELPSGNEGLAARRQAQRVVDEALQRHQRDNNIQCGGQLLMVRLHHAEQRQREAEEAMRKAEQLMLEHELQLDQAGMVDLMRAHRSLGHLEAAREVAAGLSRSDIDDPRVSEEIEAIGLNERERETTEAFRARNREAMSDYLARRDDKAIAGFKAARELAPDNMSIVLNLAQAILRRWHETERIDDEDLRLVHEALSAAHELPSDDYRRRRLLELQRLASDLPQLADDHSSDIVPG